MQTLQLIMTALALGGLAVVVINQRQLLAQGNEMADQVAQLRSDVAILKQAAADAAARTSVAQASLQSIIDDLKAHPAAADLTDIIADVESTSAGLAAIDPAAPTPPTP